VNPTKLSSIITKKNVEVFPGPDQELLLLDKTVELWQWDVSTPRGQIGRRLKRWIRSRHILWILVPDETEEFKKQERNKDNEKKT